VSGVLAATAVAHAGQDVRFSQRLTTDERAETGLGRLSVDQLAVLDALIRRDEQLQRHADTARPSTRFTQRLSPGELQTTGLASLTVAELARLDAQVARDESGELPAIAAGASGALGPFAFRRPAPEIHGMISLTYGAGSGGYHEIGGSVMLDYEDPAHGFSLLVGYEETHGSGPSFGCGRLGSGWRRHLFDGLPPIVH